MEVVSIDDKQLPDVSSYDSVVLGAPIYAGEPPMDFVHFCKKHEDTLLQQPLHVFVCGLVRKVEKQQTEIEAAVSQELRDHATQAVFLGGRMTYSDLSLPEKLMMKAMKQAKDQDTLDEARILEFAKTI